ncbi:Centromere/kinetochore protein zw10-like protein [Smittium culicis]|uniref:Centromere/kinetochore protein zw10-like protein n=1 Tax=Smittium culicis TaxID=133412 RepID=A0A1R1YD48_9FUNG|nr:Centromere/kinetochore protein zw10-like protein [Smittium culicis]
MTTTQNEKINSFLSLLDAIESSGAKAQNDVLNKIPSDPLPLAQKDVKALLAKLDALISNKKAEINDFVKSDLDLFNSISSESDKLFKKMSMMSNVIEELQNQWLSDKSSIGARIEEATREKNSLTSEIETNSKIISVLNQLKDINLVLSESDIYIREDKFAKASNSILSADRIENSKSHIQENSLKTFLSGINLSIDTYNVSLSISINQNSVADIFSSSEILGYQQQISDSFYNSIISPIIKNISSAIIKSSSISENQLIVELLDQSQEAENIHEKIHTFLLSFSNFLKDFLFPNKYNSYLEKYIRLNPKDPNWSKIIVKFFDAENVSLKTNEWESLTHDSLILESELLKIGAISPNSKPFTDFSLEAKSHFIQHKVNLILESARKSVLDSKYIDIPSDEISLNIPNTISSLLSSHENLTIDQFPKCLISTSTVELVQQLYNLFDLAFDDSSNQSPQTSLFTSKASSVIDIFISLRYESNKKNFAKVLLLNIIYFNDCVFISHHLTYLFSLIKSIVTDADNSSLRTSSLKSSKDLVKFAGVALSNSINKLSCEISTFFSSVGDLQNSSRSDKFDKVSKFIKKASFFILNISKSISSTQDTTTSHIRNIVVGNLINKMLSIVYDNIIDLEYISAPDSESLNQICKLMLEKSLEIFSTEDPSKGSEQTSADYVLTEVFVAKISPRYVPIIEKFIQICDIMVLSMSDIIGRYQIGLFDCFDYDHDHSNTASSPSKQNNSGIKQSSRIVSRLVATLFEDSETRSKTLAMLK